jgi:hypothetical protein
MKREVIPMRIRRVEETSCGRMVVMASGKRMEAVWCSVCEKSSWDAKEIRYNKEKDGKTVCGVSLRKEPCLKCPRDTRRGTRQRIKKLWRRAKV